MRQKVFGIGFHKTGTKSLKVALETLGYSVTGPNGVLRPDIATAAWDICEPLIEQFDAFQDNPWPILFRQLYAYRPDSKFVLTVRATDRWMQSAVTYFARQSTPMRQWIYGTGNPTGNEARYIERYERHNREVREFFADKPSALLVMDFSAGDGWSKLCTFLGEHAPATPFPHMNAGSPVAPERS